MTDMHTPLYSVYTRASGALARRHGDLGMRTKWSDLAAVAEDAAALPAGIGVMVQRLHGSLGRGRFIGYRSNGDRIDEMALGTFDDYALTPEDWKALERVAAERPLIVYSGFPVTARGVRALKEWPRDLCPIAIDMAGVNVATAALLAAGCRFHIEPYPRVDRVCDWFERDMPSVTTAAYARRLESEAWLPPASLRHVIAYNGNEDGLNFWDQDEADVWAERGFAVACPRRFLSVGDAGDGVGVEGGAA